MLLAYNKEKLTYFYTKYQNYINRYLSMIGINYVTRGAQYLSKLILIACCIEHQNPRDITMKNLYETYSDSVKEQGLTSSTIKSNVDYAFNHMNMSTAKSNFKELFRTDIFEQERLTPKATMRELVRRITRKEYMDAAKTSNDARHYGMVDNPEFDNAFMVMEPDENMSEEQYEKEIEKLNNTPTELDVDDDDFKFRC